MRDGASSVLVMPIVGVGAIIAVASIAAFLTHGVPSSAPALAAEDEGALNAVEAAHLAVGPPAGEPVVTALSSLRILDAAGEHVVPLAVWEASIGATWDAGESVCIVGPAPCHQQTAVTAVYLEQPGSVLRIA